MGSFWPIFQGRNRIGRVDAADGLDIAIDDPTTSSEHAVILASARPGRLKLEDIGSTNGTYLNGTHLPGGSRHELTDGDVVLFGGFEVTVKIV
jgi:pSer/pThr/pTyr-binding forkhead associated (FHA) protein